MAMKQCKECGAEISNSAKECPKCGKDQRNFFQKHTVLTVIIVLIVLGAIVSGTGGSNTNTISTSSSTVSTNEEPQAPIEYITVDIDEMEEALKNNAATAKDTYNDKYFEITGKLSNIDSDLKYISLSSLTNDFDLTGVQCYIKNDEQKEIVKTLTKGDTIIVKGKIKSVGEVLGYSLDIAEIVK